MVFKQACVNAQILRFHIRSFLLIITHDAFFFFFLFDISFGSSEILYSSIKKHEN